DSHKFEEVQVVYGGMSIMPSLALYGSILVSVETPYSRIQGNGFRYYSSISLSLLLRSPKSSSPAPNDTQMEQAAAGAAVGRSYRVHWGHGRQSGCSTGWTRKCGFMKSHSGWRAVNAFDAEEWDASCSLLEFLSQLWGWENVIVLAVCYITDLSNILVVLSCLGGFVLERLLRECLDLTLKNSTREEGARTDNPPLTEALLSA
ncbi:hypothetical protein FOZ63_026792, partial [Perkinsus olseni]